MPSLSGVGCLSLLGIVSRKDFARFLEEITLFAMGSSWIFASGHSCTPIILDPLSYVVDVVYTMSRHGFQAIFNYFDDFLIITCLFNSLRI